MCCPYRCQNPTQNVQRRTAPGQNAAGGHLQSRTAAEAVTLQCKSAVPHLRQIAEGCENVDVQCSQIGEIGSVDAIEADQSQG